MGYRTQPGAARARGKIMNVAISNSSKSEEQETRPRKRIESLVWSDITRDLDSYGNAILPEVLTPDECLTVAAMYEQPSAFRSRVVMGRHGFGRGEYQYFKYPLPSI